MEKLRELLSVPAINEAHLWLQHLDKKVLLKETDTIGDNKSLSPVEDNDVSHFNYIGIKAIVVKFIIFYRHLSLKLRKDDLRRKGNKLNK